MRCSRFFLGWRRWGIIAKFPNAENDTDGKPGFILKVSKQVSAENVYLAQAKREKSVMIPINSSTES